MSDIFIIFHASSLNVLSSLLSLGTQSGQRTEEARGRDFEEDTDAIKALANEVNENKEAVKEIREDVKEMKGMMQELLKKLQDTATD